MGRPYQRSSAAPVGRAQRVLLPLPVEPVAPVEPVPELPEP
jgi:hypothetical protein